MYNFQSKELQKYEKNMQVSNNYVDWVSRQLAIRQGIIITPYMGFHNQQQGETLQGIEIKYDKKMKIYNNIYIETHEKTNKNNKNWIESGILKTDNSIMWIIGDYSRFFLISKKQLLNIYKNIKTDIEKKGVKSKYLINIKETATSRGYIIPCDVADEICIVAYTFFD